MSAYIDLQGFTKIYKRFKQEPVLAVDKLDLGIKKGEIIALLGPSGCGKTSILRMLAGFEAITAGVFTLNGRILNNLPPKLRNIAMAFEGYALYPTLTVKENISFSLKRRQQATVERANEKKLAEIINILELKPILNQYPAALSSGEQQKTSLARAFIKNSDLCLLDEPLSQLESSVRIKLRARIKEFLRRYKMTCIIVTHNQSDAIALADRVAVMNEGKLMQYAPSDDLKKRPRNLFVASFIGQPPMNLLPVTAQYKNATLTLDILNKAQRSVWTLKKKCQLPQKVGATLKRKEIILGVLPHRLQLTSIKNKRNNNSNQIAQATILSNQWMGDQSDIMLELAGVRMMALQYNILNVASGKKIAVDILGDELHLFVKDSGHALWHTLA